MKLYRYEVFWKESWMGIYRAGNAYDYYESKFCEYSSKLNSVGGEIQPHEICFFTELGLIKCSKIIGAMKKFYKEQNVPIRRIEIEHCKHSRIFYDGKQAFFNREYIDKVDKKIVDLIK